MNRIVIVSLFVARGAALGTRYYLVEGRQDRSTKMRHRSA
jgi:hypothetical protein